LKKSLIIFAVAFALPMVLALLSLLGLFIIVTSSTSSSSILSSPSLLDAENQAFSLVYFLVSVFAAFALFYFLGKKIKINVVKSVTLALFIGLLIGILVGDLMTVTLFYVFSGGFSWVASIEVYISDISGLLSRAFELFFPALVALLFVELRERNSHNELSP
jgi:hypothetical protein